MKKINLNETNAKQYGRTYFTDNVLKLIMSASGCEFLFKGKKLILSLGCDEDCFNSKDENLCPRAAILVNGNFYVKKVIASRKEDFVICDSEKSVEMNVKIVKLSEAAFSIAEVYPAETDASAEIIPLPEKTLKIEFIGDSITCGYGVDDGNVMSEFSTCAENSMKSFAYLTAKALDADYSMFSASGYGIISGYTHDGTRNSTELLPPYYESLGFSFSRADDKLKPQEIKWDFSRFVPDIAVINLGTNDSSFCGNSELLKSEFEAAYFEFLMRVRSHYPNAKIICSLGIMESLLLPCVKSACDRYKQETGDKNVYMFEFTAQDGMLGYSSKWHPSEDTHKREAERITSFIEDILKKD